jgi:hypothetical protein
MPFVTDDDGNDRWIFSQPDNCDSRKEIKTMDVLTRLQEIRETVSNMRNSGEVTDGAYQIIVDEINRAIRDYLKSIGAFDNAITDSKTDIK